MLCVFASPIHANGGCVFANPSEIIAPAPAVTGGGGFADPHRHIIIDDNDVMMAVIKKFLEVVSG